MFWPLQPNAQARKINPGDLKERFSVIEAHLSNGKPVVGSINTAYKSYQAKYLYPWCLTINIALDLKNVKSNGLPNKDESNTAYKIEDELLSKIKKITRAAYIGHLFNDSFLDIYIYLDEPDKVNEFLQTQVNKKGVLRGFRYEIKQDKDWSAVSYMLK